MATAQMCPMHTDEHVQPEAVLNETMDYLYTCTRTDGHARPGPYSWPWSAPPVHTPSTPTAFDLGDALVEAITRASHDHGGGWVEHGLVERAYALANPEQWSALLERYDHTHYWPRDVTKAELPYTASKRLGLTLGTLRRQADVAFRQGPGTGRWAYNAPSSYYAPLSVTDDATTCTWADSGCQMADYMPTARPAT